jgi:hypothetical protein
VQHNKILFLIFNVDFQQIIYDEKATVYELEKSPKNICLAFTLYVDDKEMDYIELINSDSFTFACKISYYQSVLFLYRHDTMKKKRENCNQYY